MGPVSLPVWVAVQNQSSILEIWDLHFEPTQPVRRRSLGLSLEAPGVFEWISPDFSLSCFRLVRASAPKTSPFSYQDVLGNVTGTLSGRVPFRGFHVRFCGRFLSMKRKPAISSGCPISRCTQLLCCYPEVRRTRWRGCEVNLCVGI